jgi:subtilisin family serine protease
VGGVKGPRSFQRVPQAGSAPFETVPEEIVVQYRKGVSRSAKAGAAARIGARVVSRAPSLGVQNLRIQAGRSVDAAIERLLGDPSVRFAEPNHVLYPTVTPNDTHFAQLWGELNTGQAHWISDGSPPTSQTVAGTAGNDAKVTTAWDSQQGNASVRIAVIDTGVDTDHPDLMANLVPGQNFGGGPLPASDPNPNPLQSGYQHGTHVAGTIGAVMNNNVGVAGVCPSCKVVPIRFKFDLASEIQAIAWAINPAKGNADIINMSFGGGPWSDIERNAIKAAGSKQVLVVVAAANNAADNDISTFVNVSGNWKWVSPMYPASYGLPNILAVAASNHNDEYGYFTGCFINQGNPKSRCAFTNVGRTNVDVAAPGTDILSTVPVGGGRFGTGNGYDVYNGTSMASPFTAGIAGLVKAAHPGYKATQVKNAIMNSVDKPGNLKNYIGGKGTFTVTGGRVNALKALTGATKDPKKTNGTIAGATGINKKVTGTVSWPNKPNAIFKKKLTKGKSYKLSLKTSKKGPVDLWILEPGTQDIGQWDANCLSKGVGSPKCSMLGVITVKKNKKPVYLLKPRKSGMHYFQMTSFYNGKPASLTLTLTKA